MNKYSQTVDQSFVNAQRRWRRIRLLRNGSIGGLLLCCFAFVLGMAIVRGWVSTRQEAIWILAGVGLLAGAGLVKAVITIIVTTPGRVSIAAELERTDPRFQDRLNTLLFLENSKTRPESVSFLKRIADQARRVLMQKKPPAPFSAGGALLWTAAFVTMLACLGWLNHRYAPWARLKLTPGIGLAQSDSSAQQPESPLPARSQDPARQDWGEIRVIEPGTDLTATKVDVVPLSIEAAANQDLVRIEWRSSVNGGKEKEHELPPPSEPRYAVYQPIIYLDELELSDWDVLTYYAKAQTSGNKSYASEVYFIEVRPFREDIAKIPGGQGGQPYQTLNDLSSLVGRQQHVIRDTHQFVQRPPVQEQVRIKTSRDLAQTEADLGDAAQHLYADMASRMENQPIGAALDNLAQAQISLGLASGLLKDNHADQAQNVERAALAQLVAARKIYQKAVSDHPGQFEQPGQRDSAPIADSSKKLSEMAEYRDEAKSAQEFVRKTLEQQKDVERQAGSGMRDSSALARQEQRLGGDLKNFAEEHPRAFKGSQPETDAAEQALQRSEESLRDSRADRASAAAEASQNLAKLEAAIQSSAAGQQLADAYRLKRMLDEHARSLGQFAKPDVKASTQEMEQEAGATQAVLDQLKKKVAEKSASTSFGPALRDALNATGKSSAEQALSDLLQAQSDTERRDAAQTAESALNQISKAFTASQPKPLQEGRQKDLLQPNTDRGFAQGMSQLQSLLKRLEQNRETSPDDRAKQARQGLANLQAALNERAGQDSATAQLLQELQQMLEKENGLDPERLKQLLAELDRFAVETALKPTGRDLNPDVANIDPARLPPAYRTRIERYFQKLSEE